MDVCMYLQSAHTHTHICIRVPQARSLQAIPRLVKLFNHANQEVQRHATGAMRNLIYDNADNKLALVEENGIFELLRTLREQDDELRKNVTGVPCPTCPPTLSPPPRCPPPLPPAHNVPLLPFPVSTVSVLPLRSHLLSCVIFAMLGLELWASPC